MRRERETEKEKREKKKHTMDQEEGNRGKMITI